MVQAGDPRAGKSIRVESLGPVERLASPERVQLDLEIAGPMSRALAFSIDYSIVLLGITLCLVLFVAASQQLIEWFATNAFFQRLFDRVSEWIQGTGESEGGSVPRGVALAVSLWLILDLVWTTAYFVVFETFFRGRTPGKRWAGLRVVSVKGGVIRWPQSLLRNLLRLVDSLPTGYLVGVVAIVISPRGQRLGDLVAGTVVIREREALAGDAMSDAVVAPEIEAAFRFTREELAAVGEVERRLIRRTLRRAESLPEETARPILERATRAIARRLAREEPVAPEQQRDFLLALLQASERMR
ncbi:MAG TPA: RDD family protein [Deltaproteobacteria bacterium]|nr:RDD family protein [Deltaproteobacteria bacterium]